ncbi:unnamed protein product [Bemisia tabaci]|uniref:MYND-type domain-containing protein n=1 Tax=Bemisia tabaci TaxID=7038 RepID=A0A9P0APG0_BEMTA|nr:unnamed protein product [Bemisia tabaci]
MSIHTSGLPTFLSTLFPLGNVPPVCLTQDLPPEADAHILLLGCGDARNILFTCFADNKRKLDVTCCDIAPMIHARNVLLYTLISDDESNENIELIWNLYYHWKIDGNSVDLLESQIQRLLAVSESIDHWHNSVYGSMIRFCDEKSLSCVRAYWEGFTTRGLSNSAKKDRLKRLQTAIDRVREDRLLNGGPDYKGYRALFPTNMNVDGQAWSALDSVAKQWWGHGMVSAENTPAVRPAHLNPVFLYSPDGELTMHEGTSPLGSLPLCTAYILLSKECPLYQEKKGRSPTEHLVNCAKSNFFQWAPAFRKAIKNGSVIRIFSGHAFPFCFTLRNCQLTGSTSMNLPFHNWTNSPLILHHSDYGDSKDSAPLSFDVIDTSNLADYLGPLNVVALTSSLLKRNVSSCLYTQLMVMFDSSLQERLTNLFGVDVRSMSFLLGLVLPDLFTNATSTVDEYPNIDKIIVQKPGSICRPTVVSRLRWRRLGTPGMLPSVQVEAKELAKFLTHVHRAMFQLDDLPDIFGHHNLTREDALKDLHRPYNRASFAFLLSHLKATLTVDWDECLKEIYNVLGVDGPKGSSNDHHLEDLLLNLHTFGVDSSHFTKPNPANMNGTVLASVLSECEDLPDQLCVTIRVPKKHLNAIGKCLGSQGIVCHFEGRNPQGQVYRRSFSSVQMAFRKLDESNGEVHSNPLSFEGSGVFFCTSDVFASVMVPTSMLISMLLQSVPKVKFIVKYNPMTYMFYFMKLGPELCFFSTEITSSDVSITKFMPGMSGLPRFINLENREVKLASNSTSVRFSGDGLKINSLIRRITLESEIDKAVLANKSSVVQVKFLSPYVAVANIGRSLEFKFEFPAPVSISKHRVRIARKSSYIEIESRFLDPVEEDVPAFLFPCFLSQTPPNIVSWSSMRVNLDVMPSIDLDNGQELTWLNDYLGQMFSREEYQNFLSRADDLRVSIKESIMQFFMGYAGLYLRRDNFVCLEGMDQSRKALILPSCLRLDLASYSVVLDSALIPLTNTVMSDKVVTRFLKKLYDNDVLRKVPVNDSVNRAWKAMMPAMVERCRTWNHTSGCDYKKIGEVPLPQGLDRDGESSICTCGVGKFPKGYLKDLIKEFSAVNHLLRQYATRVAISPFFAVTYVDNCDLTDFINVMCSKCGDEKRKNPTAKQQSLLKCSRCKTVQYCSVDCQKADWKQHKVFCKAMQDCVP